MGGQLRNLPLGHPHVVEPLHADLPPGALPHGLFHKVARLVAEQAVDPPNELPSGLVAELGLAVEGPAQQPVGVPGGDDAAGDHLPGEGVPLADTLDIGGNFVVQGGDGGAHPVAQLRLGAELVRPAEGGVPRGDAPPHVPAAAGLQLRPEGGGGILGTQGGILHAAAGGEEHQVVFRQVNVLLRPVPQQHQAAGLLAAGPEVELHVHHPGVEVELDAVRLQVLEHGQDHGLILVVAGEAQGGEVGQAPHVVDEALEVELHLQGGVPVLKGEHGAPVEPEVGLQHRTAEHVRDGPVVQGLVGGEEQLHDLHGALVAQAELAVGVGVLPPVDRGPHEGVVGIPLVEPVVLVQDGHALGLDGRDGAEQIPHDLEVVVHLPAAPHDIAQSLVVPAVAGAAGDGLLLQDVDVPAGHLPVPHQIAGRRQGRQAGAHQIGRFMLHALRLHRAGKGLVIAAGIIHENASVS